MFAYSIAAGVSSSQLHQLRNKREKLPEQQADLQAYPDLE